MSAKIPHTMPVKPLGRKLTTQDIKKRMEEVNFFMYNQSLYDGIEHTGILERLKNGGPDPDMDECRELLDYVEHATPKIEKDAAYAAVCAFMIAGFELGMNTQAVATLAKRGFKMLQDNPQSFLKDTLIYASAIVGKDGSDDMVEVAKVMKEVKAQFFGDRGKKKGAKG